MDHADLLAQAIEAVRGQDLATAIELLNTIVQTYPDDVTARSWLGSLYAQREQYAAALETLQTAIALDPRRARSHAALAQVFVALRRYPEAEAAALRSLELSPSSATCVVLGAAQSALGKNVDARRSFRRALTLDPKNEEAMLNLALEVEETAPRSALKLLEAAIAIDPQYGEAYREYGWQLALTGNTGRAEEMLRKAIATDPSDSLGHVYLGNIFASTGRSAEAESMFQRARELAPVDALPTWTLANLYESQGRPDDAGALYRHAVDLAPRDAEPAFQLARFLISSGSLTEGVRWLDRALKLDPGHAMALEWRKRARPSGRADS